MTIARHTHTAIGSCTDLDSSSKAQRTADARTGVVWSSSVVIFSVEFTEFLQFVFIQMSLTTVMGEVSRQSFYHFQLWCSCHTASRTKLCSTFCFQLCESPRRWCLSACVGITLMRTNQHEIERGWDIQILQIARLQYLVPRWVSTNIRLLFENQKQSAKCVQTFFTKAG